MFGFADIWVALAYILCILSAALCVYYGIKHWNDDIDFQAPKHPTDENLDFEEDI